MVDKEPKRGKKGKEKDPIDWKDVESVIVTKLAEPDTEDPSRRRYAVIDGVLVEAVIGDLDKSGLTEAHLEKLRQEMIKKIIDTKALTLARLDNYRYLSTKPELERMDTLLSTLRALNPTMTFRTTSDYAALFTQELARPKPIISQVIYDDPTAPARFDPDRPIAPGNFLDNVLGEGQARFIGDPPNPAGEKVNTSPLPNNYRVMNSRS